MDFKYLEKADKFVEFRDNEVKCAVCGKTKICFDAEAFRGQDEFDSVCPECLRTGKLSKYDISTCDGDLHELKKQLKDKNPNLLDSEIEKIAQDKTIELETTTPHLVTWQDWFWPCADGDYCKFIGFGSKPLYEDLAGEIEVVDFFKDSFYQNESYFDYLWDDVLADEEISNYEDSNEYGTLFYVFKSLHSDQIITIWDSE